MTPNNNHYNRSLDAGVHLSSYLAEFDFRHSTCKDSDSVRMGALVSRVGGRRLAYQPTRRAR